MKLTSVNEINIETLKEYNRLKIMLNKLCASDDNSTYVTMEFRNDKGLYGTLRIDKEEADDFLTKRIEELEAEIKSF